ncbi:MAG TPA: hydrogenase expression/formation protein HypE [Acidobacteriaceae bacterium]|jgi:hydrogenase expression/formation protein HypE|nr:hydrogenase expression/formation protein HypE [Acidobacteriaceae bacterium]
MGVDKVDDREETGAGLGPFGVCPLPIFEHPQIVLGHGSGGKLSAELIEKVFVSRFRNSTLEKMDDQAVLEIGGTRLAFTTDSFVVTPIFFPGGDIGSLAVNGTVNDLAMGGAKPLYLSAAFILEEGLPATELERVVDSMAAAAHSAGVQLVTGDTKVVNRGKGDKIFITTTGIGVVDRGTRMSADRARPGDKILLSGYVGDHGITILSQREGLEFESALESDCAALNGLVDAMLDAAGGAVDGFRVMRDPTRGGVATVLNEIAGRSKVRMMLRENEIPVRDSVRGACEMLGLDPLYVANEGKLVAVVAPEIAEPVLAAMRAHPLGAESRVIGEVVEAHAGMVLMKTGVGGTRVVDVMFGEQLPRIC